jgi:hypothetical protein
LVALLDRVPSVRGRPGRPRRRPGRGGDDRIVGGDGDDRMSGGTGDDTIVSKDRYRDTIHCGPGRDGVVADYRDRIGRDCEDVRR